MTEAKEITERGLHAGRALAVPVGAEDETAQGVVGVAGGHPDVPDHSRALQIGERERLAGRNRDRIGVATSGVVRRFSATSHAASEGGEVAEGCSAGVFDGSSWRVGPVRKLRRAPSACNSNHPEK